MEEEHKSDRREFVRVPCRMPASYRLISLTDEKVDERVFDGQTSNISPSGVLLRGPIPDSKYLAPMLQQKIAVAVMIQFPNETVPVKAIARVCWFESIEGSPECCHLGLNYREITLQDVDRIMRLIIQSKF